MSFLSETVIATTVDGQKVEVIRKDLRRAAHCYAICVRDGKVLILPQWKENGFGFPGGSIELGEDHAEGLVREIKEETGYEIRLRGVIDVFTSIFMNYKNNKAQHSLLVYYAADVVRGRRTDEGFSEHEKQYAKMAKWVTLEELKGMQFTCNTQEPMKIIRKYLEAKIAIGK